VSLTPSDPVNALADQFNKVLKGVVCKRKNDDFGIFPSNTTLFSVVLFSKADNGIRDPIFNTYYHTAPSAGAGARLISQTVVALGGQT
jgi:hypothetical protein